MSLGEQGNIRCYWVGWYVSSFKKGNNPLNYAIGFDYQFNAIENEGNELFSAYKDMFEVAVSQQSQGALKSILVVYFPIIDKILKVIPRERTTYLFSATMTTKVQKLQRASLSNPIRIEVSEK